jgi:hypothetical protein
MADLESAEKKKVEDLVDSVIDYFRELQTSLPTFMGDVGDVEDKVERMDKAIRRWKKYRSNAEYTFRHMCSRIVNMFIYTIQWCEHDKYVRIMLSDKLFEFLVRFKEYNDMSLSNLIRERLYHFRYETPYKEEKDFQDLDFDKTEWLKLFGDPMPSILLKL